MVGDAVAVAWHEVIAELVVVHGRQPIPPLMSSRLALSTPSAFSASIQSSLTVLAPCFDSCAAPRLPFGVEASEVARTRPSTHVCALKQVRTGLTLFSRYFVTTYQLFWMSCARRCVTIERNPARSR